MNELGELVEFLVDGDGERLAGVIVEKNITNYDGWHLVAEDMPCLRVAVSNGGSWLVPEIWLVK